MARPRAGISAEELAQLRHDQEDYFPDTCAILQPTWTPDTIGDPVLTFATTVGTAACRLRPAPFVPNVVTPGGQLATEQKWYLNVAAGGTAYGGAGTVGPGWRFVMTAGTFEVVQSWEEGSWASAIRCEVRRVEA